MVVNGYNKEVYIVMNVNIMYCRLPLRRYHFADSSADSTSQYLTVEVLDYRVLPSRYLSTRSSFSLLA